MAINLTVPKNNETPNLKPRITVIGVGGAGGNAVNNMIEAQLEGVNFVVANTDSQALTTAKTDQRIQLGLTVTKGLGAGSRPEIGRQAAEESIDELLSHIEGSNMVFITAGMGGGTGTGAAPIIAKAAREKNILTVGVVTRPFAFEGRNREKIAEDGIAALQEVVDTQIVIPNQNLFRIADEKTTFADAFRMADDVLHQGVRSITDLMIMPGLINLDFADIQAVMYDMGKAMMGTGEAEGERRGPEAAEKAISNPLLEATSIEGARGMLISVTGGMDMTLWEVDEAASFIRDKVDGDANIIFGATFDESLQGKLRVSVVATGLDGAGARQPDSTRGQSPRSFADSLTQFTAASPPESETMQDVESELENGDDQTVEYDDLASPEAAVPTEEPEFGDEVEVDEDETVDQPIAPPSHSLDESAPQSSTGPLSLFERVTGTGRATLNLDAVTHLRVAPKAEVSEETEENDENVEVPLKDETPDGDAPQGLDIPAFLRRRK